MNADGAFCQRASRYTQLNADRVISSRTSFCGAAAIVINALADKPQSAFMQELSANLESANNERADQIRSGKLYANGSVQQNTADFVHFEQSNVQTAFNNLAASSPSTFSVEVGAANKLLNGPASIIANATDPAFARAVSATKKALGRDIDFANQGDRERHWKCCCRAGFNEFVALHRLNH